MLNLFYDKNEHMHTQGLHCEIKQALNLINCYAMHLLRMNGY